ncbi:MAG: AhpC/TSA family protein [Prevotellaceae bacterium]|nr:AhpC/TSA family protein [Prevotellaceae bacterium]
MRYLLSFLMVCLLVSCNKTGYKITGKLPTDELNGKTIYLVEYSFGGANSKETELPLDSTVVQDNSFTFSGKIDRPVMAEITADPGSMAFIFVFVENYNINISFFDDKPFAFTLSGSPLNDQYTEYSSGIRALSEQSEELQKTAQSKEMTEETITEMNANREKLNEQYRDYTLRFIEKYPASLFTAVLLLESENTLTADDIIAAYDRLPNEVRKSDAGMELEQTVARLKIAPVAIGQKFRELKLKTPEGKDIAISDYAGKGKYVLLDFWASWCGPCRSENPNLVALYNKYKDKGLEIVGISLDHNRDDWKAAIEADKMSWVHMSELVRPSSAANEYKVETIPFTVLLDPEGKVIETRLRGEDLANKLKEIFTR